MAVKTKVLSVAQKATTGTQATTGVGFLPVGLLAFGNSKIADGSAVGNQFGIGGGRNTTDGGSVFGISTDNAATTNTAWRRIGAASNGEIWNINSVTPTILGEANVDSLDADGFTLNYATSDGTARILNILALGGCNFHMGVITAPAAAGDKAEVMGNPFRPTAVIFFVQGFTTGAWEASANGNVTGMVGFTAGLGKDRVCNWRYRDAQAAADTSRAYFEDACITSVTTPTEGGATQTKATLKTFNADGFTLNYSVTAGQHNFGYIAFDGVLAAVGTVAQPTSTGVQTVSGVGFSPQCVFLMSTNDDTSGARDSARFSFGIATSTSERACCWFGDTDAADPTVSDHDLDRTKVIKMMTEGTPTVDAAADFNGFTGNGFKLDWTTADATARNLFYLAIRDATPSGGAGRGRGGGHKGGGGVALVGTGGASVLQIGNPGVSL